MIDVPEHMAHLPRTKAGSPVPHVSAWSSERWGIARMDPLVGNRWALYSEGRQGRGRPILASINEERQRRSVMLSRCQVCDAALDRSELFVTNVALHLVEVEGRELLATYSPPTCWPCLVWSVDHCPGLRRIEWTVRFDKTLPVAQMLDPSKGPMRGVEKFDGGDNPATRERLGVIARKNGGLVGHVKLAVSPDDMEPWGKHE